MITEPAANDDTMDLQEAAAFMKCGLRAMRELVDTGEVPALQINQKHTLLLRADLISYVHEQGRAQAAKRRARKAGTPTPSHVPATPPRHRRGSKSAKPDLSPYELTTAARRD